MTADGDVEVIPGSLGLKQVYAIARDPKKNGSKSKKFAKEMQINAELYIAALSAEELLAQGREKNFGIDRDAFQKALAEGQDVTELDFFSQELAEQRIKTIKEFAEKYPVLKEVQREHAKWSKALLNFADANGLVNAENRAQFERDFYTPMYRVDEAAQVADAIRGPDGGLKNPKEAKKIIRRLKGGTGRVAVLENQIKGMNATIEQSYINMAKRTAVRYFGGNASVMVRAKHTPKPYKTSKGELIEALATQRFYDLQKTNELPPKVRGDLAAFIRLAKSKAAAGQFDLIGMTNEKELDRSVTLFRMQRPIGDNIMSVMEDGKPQYWEIKDPMFMESVNAMGPDIWKHADNFFVQWLAIKPKNLLTGMITATPGFMGRNSFRDTLGTWAASKEVKIPGLSAVIGAKKILMTKDGFMDNMGFSGLGDQGYDMWKGNPMIPNNARSDFMRLSKDERRSFLGSVINTPVKLFKGYQKIVEMSEMMNRAGLASAVKDAGGSNMMAAYRGLDIANFGSHGGHEAARLIMHTVPFLNARIQGQYFLARNAAMLGRPNHKEQGKAFRNSMLMLTFATLALAAVNWEDDRYWARPQWERDMYYLFFFDDDSPNPSFRMPKPFEIGAIASTIPELIVGSFGGKLSGAEGKDAIARLLTQTLAINPGVLGTIAYEEVANVNLFTGLPIENIGDQFEKNPEERYDEYTPEMFKTGAKAMPDSFPEWARSPKRLEHMWRGMLGSVGAYVADSSDMLWRRASGSPERPKRQWRDRALSGGAIKSFFPSSTPKTDKFVSEFYELLKLTDGFSARAQYYREQKQPEKAREIEQKNRDALLMLPMLESTKTQISEITKQKNAIIGHPGMSPEAKRRQVDVLTIKRNKVAKQAYDIFHRPR